MKATSCYIKRQELLRKENNDIVKKMISRNIVVKEYVKRILYPGHHEFDSLV